MENDEKLLAELIEAGEEFDYKIPNVRIVVMNPIVCQDAKKMEQARKHLNRFGEYLVLQLICFLFYFYRIQNS